MSSGFNPGKRISTGCYDMPSAVLWAEKYLRDMGMVSDADVPLFRDFAKDFYNAARCWPSSLLARPLWPPCILTIVSPKAAGKA